MLSVNKLTRENGHGTNLAAVNLEHVLAEGVRGVVTASWLATAEASFCGDGRNSGERDDDERGNLVTRVRGFIVRM